MKSTYLLILLISSGLALSFNWSNTHGKDESDSEKSIVGFWEGKEPGSEDYKIVFKIVKRDSPDYTGTGYGFYKGNYAEHWNLDSVSFNNITNELFTYNKSHNCIYKGIVDFNKQSISGIIKSYEVNGELTMKRTKEKALKGLYPRGSTENEIVTYKYKQPDHYKDGWETSTLEKEGVNSQLVIEAVNKIINEEFVNITSLLIVKNNKLVCEEYFYGYNESCLNRLASCSKSVTSLLVGIATDEGQIKSINESVIEYFPEYDYLKTDKNSQVLTKHLLTMTAGFEWDEFEFPYAHPQNTLRQMSESDDYLKFIFERPMVDVPGDKFNYSCACTILLGWILKQSTGLDPDLYAEKKLFKSLGIDDYYWHKREDGFPHVEGGLWLTARDMAKIGSLVLNKGKWENKQIVSENWIEESTQQHVSQNNMQPGYGYQWWNIYYPVNDKTIYGILAMGADPQKIIIIPELETIIVTTGSFTFIDENKSPLRMIMQYIVTAVL